MTLRKTIVLAFVLAAILLYITKVELANDEQKQATAQPFLKIAAQSFEHVTVTDSDGSFTLVNVAPKPDAIVKLDGDASLSDEDIKSWSIQGIKSSDVDRGAINALLSAIRNEKLESPLKAEDTDKDLGVYGLAQPDLTLELKTAAADETLKFGKLNTYVSKRYVQLNSVTEIYLVSNDLYTAAHKKGADFRNHAPIATALNDIARLTLQSPDGAMTLEQSEGNWKFTAPGPFTADSFAVDELMRQLRSTHASGFIDDAAGQEAQYGLQAPFITVSIELKKDAAQALPLTIKFGKVEHPDEKDKKNATKFYMQVSGKDPIFELGADPSARVAKSVDDLREKQLVKLATDRVDSVEIAVTGRETVTLARSGSNWKVNGADADAPFVEGFLRSLADLSASGFPEQQGDFGFDKPMGRITLTLHDVKGAGSEKKTIIIGNKVEGKTPGFAAEVEGMHEPFIISSEVGRDLTPRAEALKKSENAPAAAETPAPAAPAGE